MWTFTLNPSLVATLSEVFTPTAASPFQLAHLTPTIGICSRFHQPHHYESWGVTLIDTWQIPTGVQLITQAAGLNSTRSHPSPNGDKSSSVQPHFSRVKIWTLSRAFRGSSACAILPQNASNQIADKLLKISHQTDVRQDGTTVTTSANQPFQPSAVLPAGNNFHIMQIRCGWVGKCVYKSIGAIFAEPHSGTTSAARVQKRDLVGGDYER